MAKMTIPTFKIESVEDVRQFFQWLLKNNMLTHPDDSFHYMIDNMEEDGEEPDITREQADYLDDVMVQCFDLCDENDIDLYGVCFDEVASYNSLVFQTR